MARFEGKHLKKLRTTPLGRQAKPFLWRSNRGEFIIHCVTWALAIGSSAFAFRMISDEEREPEFGGLEYLSIFNRPSRFAVQSPYRERPPTMPAQRDIDPTSVGSIRASKSEASALKYNILRASPDSAVIQTPRATIRVGRGDPIEDLGVVATIENRNGRWTIVMRNGSILSD
jgi:hypothetical protein